MGRKGGKIDSYKPGFFIEGLKKNATAKQKDNQG